MRQAGRERGRRRALGVLLVTACTGAALAAAEAVARIVDGYRLLPLRLEASALGEATPAATARSSPQKLAGDTDAFAYVRQLPVAPGVERGWFAEKLPDRPAWRADADLAARARRYQGVDELAASYEWNWNYVTAAVCGHDPADGGDLFNRLDDIYVFQPSDGSDVPRFRFLRRVTYPSGLVTNGFGWRGQDVPLRKPPRTVRLAFVGASTTVGMHAEPYSYPELVGVWMNRWARAHHRDLAFEAINAGREGVNSHSIAAIVRQELTPLEPDMVLYYEGANQFWPVDFVTTTVLPRSRVSVPVPGTWESYSAIARRVKNLYSHVAQPGAEPDRPVLRVNWPADVDEHDPDLQSPHLPYEIRQVLGDLDRMRLTLGESGSHLAVASFVWLVHEGLVLDPVRDRLVFSYLNTTYWPFTYAHLRRFLDFQTTAFRKYASLHGVDFIDVAGAYPPDPRLFGDAIHMTSAGIRLQAWLVFNALVPIAERRLESREWPRSAQHRPTRHPAFGERRLVPLGDVRAACGREDAPAQHGKSE